MSVAFGTSGLRGPVESFTPLVCFAYVKAFLDMTGTQAGPKTLYVGMDLRKSSPSIAALCIAAARQEGWTAIHAGDVPTPALAAYAMARRCPALIITGSHIPEDRNGIKFYRRDSELLKEDEEEMRSGAERIEAEGYAPQASALPDADPAIAKAYVDRYVEAFGGDALSGLKVGIFEHSAVGRDLLRRILEGLGAGCEPFGRSERFIAVDTEALAPDMLEQMRAQIGSTGLDAVVSTDGDGDRPLVVDARGNQINGDVLCALAARELKIGTVVTPLTSTSGVELSGWFDEVRRTRIGSPYVVAEMAKLPEESGVAGFEANGGFMLGSACNLSHGKLSALPTRDAVLPILAVLAGARRRGIALAELAAELPQRVMLADRIKDVAPETGRDFLNSLVEEPKNREMLHNALGGAVDVDTMDGVRLTLGDGRIVHFRQSGNAPEFRCYVETSDRLASKALLDELMERLGVQLIA